MNCNYFLQTALAAEKSEADIELLRANARQYVRATDIKVFRAVVRNLGEKLEEINSIARHYSKYETAA